MIALFLTRWRFGLSIFAALAFIGLGFAAKHYRYTYNAEKALRQADRAAYTQAQTEALRLAQEALRHQEAVYQGKAHEADRKFTLALAGAQSAADRYASTHRVRTEAVARPASGSIASAESSGAGLPENPAPGSIVVSEQDFNACTGAVIYADQAYQWARGL